MNRLSRSGRLRLALAACSTFVALLPALVIAETAPGDPAVQPETVTVFVARRIVTMEPALPEARVVAVRGGRILALGQSLEDLAPWLDGVPHEIDRSFARSILLPGFIDPHLHPLMAAVLLPTHFITPEDWTLPRGTKRGVKTEAAYRKQLADAIAQDSVESQDAPFISWGYHSLWHGPLDRKALDAIESERPVIVWHRSFHEIIVNTRALALLGFPDAESLDQAIARMPGVDPAHASWESGHLIETALQVALAELSPHILAPEHLQRGLTSLQDMMRASGVTTIADMATGLFTGFEAEAMMIRQSFEAGEVPARVVLVPTAMALITQYGSAEAAIAALLTEGQALTSRRIWLGDRVKLLADGAFFSQYMRMNPPGYTDGHEGKWITRPAELEQMARPFWKAGFTIHCHVNGDEGLDVVLDLLERLQHESPRPDHRFTLEHFGYSTEVQNRRVATLGALVSAQPNYLYMLGVKYGEQGLGHDRASQISRLGSLEDKGVVLALHSDATMAPVDPLFLAWIATTRQSMDGGVLARNERISVDKALRAITIDAAYVLGLEDEIGSIAPGKRADFAVLKKDPRKVGAKNLRKVPVWGVIFEGEPVEATRPPR